MQHDYKARKQGLPIASGKTDLQLTDLKGIVKMMVGETK